MKKRRKTLFRKKRALKKNTINDFSKVFIVHGHDELTKIEVARFIEKLGFEAIILSEQANYILPVMLVRKKTQMTLNLVQDRMLYSSIDI